jgi:hypothetical protein
VDDPFAGKLQYTFPTYQRDETFMEKLAFWSEKAWEQPAPPAGLDKPERRTYPDSDEPAPDDTGR